MRPSQNITPDILLSKGPSARIQFPWRFVSPEDILKAVKRLKNSTSNDLYNISNNLLKQIIPSIVKPLTFVINFCLHEGFFPAELKISRVCPVYKKGQKNLPDSYRPISIIPSISKVFELLFFDQISQFLENNNILSVSQHGFRSGKSTQSAIDILCGVFWNPLKIKPLLRPHCVT